MPESPWLPRKLDLMERKIDGDLILYDPRTDSVHRLNVVAGLVWALCGGTRDLETITAEIATQFQKPPAAIANDIKEVLQRFSERGCIVEDVRQN